ncbi:MAG: dienelactone hydrolase family protein [Planctomycetota bacterium]
MVRWCVVLGLGLVLWWSACARAGAEETVVIDPWRMFCDVDLTKVEMGDLRSLPEVLPGEGGRLVRPIEVQPDANGLIDIKSIAGGFHKKACAMLFAEVHADEPTTLRIGTSADWWMEWRVNGEQVLSTLDFGNNRYYLGERNRLTDYVLDLPLETGTNLIAVKVLAGSRAWFLYAGADDEVRAARPFHYKRLADYLDRPLEFIHDEDTVPSYELPDPLTADDGTPVTGKQQWEQVRRPEILDAFNRAIYGAIPREVDRVAFEPTVEDADSLDGLARRKTVLITVARGGRSLRFPMHLFLPKAVDGPVPVVLFIYQRSPNDRWDFRVDGRYWPIRRLIENGFAAASFDRKFLAPDNPEHFREGILALYPEQTARPDGWRTISAWAYGAMRCVDYLVTDPAIDAEKIAVAGHSRGGKTALWTAANDTRISMAFVNGSGCLGAALSRRKMGERLPVTNQSNPHWYNDTYHACTDENDLPVDQHMLIALVAPRAICIGGAVGDPEADPKGEYLALIAADKVYQLYGLPPLAAQGRPRLEQPVTAPGRSYHIRYGNHDMNRYDWGVYIDAAKRAFDMGP